ncbi:hypothetical protein V8G54_029012 [Vigna mungo]|uniref:Bromo domain-containing protein n=1 Tax=Vigna mungo TaxID=3915 RepID=A0AAQ3MTP6_VIGMU
METGMVETGGMVELFQCRPNLMTSLIVLGKGIRSSTRMIQPRIICIVRGNYVILILRFNGSIPILITQSEISCFPTSLNWTAGFPVPLYPELIQSRLENDYYRTVEGVKHDIMVMLSNAEDFFRITKNVQVLGKIRRISDWFRKKLERV